jgi:hypothetical protein
MALVRERKARRADTAAEPEHESFRQCTVRSHDASVREQPHERRRFGVLAAFTLVARELCVRRRLALAGACHASAYELLEVAILRHGLPPGIGHRLRS